MRATARKRAAAATNGAATGVDGFWFGHPLLECRCSGELARLLTDPVLRGRGVPHGDGRSVLLLPGFLVSDATLRLLARFLGRIGYRPVASGIRFNSGCGDSFDERMVGVIDREYSMGGRRLAIVGHSRGGHYARSLAARYPDRVSHIVTMGAGVEDPLDVSMLTKCGAAVMRSALAGCDPARSERGCLTLRMHLRIRRWVSPHRFLPMSDSHRSTRATTEWCAGSHVSPITRCAWRCAEVTSAWHSTGTPTARLPRLWRCRPPIVSSPSHEIADLAGSAISTTASSSRPPGARVEVSALRDRSVF